MAFAGYYRRFIKDLSKKTRPLAELLPPTSKRKGQRRKEEKEFRWSEKEQTLFDNLKSILTSPPVLAYPDFSVQFELHVAASTKGLGAVLYQDQDDKKRVISYASRALTKSEKNYSAFKLEFLALKWAVTEKFSEYLRLNKFTVFTDNNPLTYILTSAKLDATGHRWASALGEYTFEIFYRPGMKNTDADIMSRYPHDKVSSEDSESRVKIDNETVKTLCCPIMQSFIETLPCYNINITEVLEAPGQTLAQKELKEVRRAQREDRVIAKWRIAVIDQTIPKNLITKEVLSMRKQNKNFHMKRGVLYRKIKDEEQETDQLV